MKNIDDLLNAAKEVTGSDNKTAASLGIDRQIVSGWRQRKSKPNDIDRAELGKITGWDYAEVVAAINYESNPEYWENFLKRLGGIAASWLATILMSVTFIVTPTPSEAAPVMKSTERDTVYYVKSRRRINAFKKALLGLVEFVSLFRVPVPRIG